MKKTWIASVYFNLSPISRWSFVGRNISRHSGLRAFVNKTAGSCHSPQKCHSSWKQATSSWISSRLDIICAFSGKKCECVMCLRCFNRCFTCEVALLLLFHSGTLRKRCVKSAPRNVMNVLKQRCGPLWRISDVRMLRGPLMNANGPLT